MSKSEQKVVQYLNEAHASEAGLVSVLRSQIAVTPRGSYHVGLEKHLDETRTHAQRIDQRLGELEQGRNPVQVFVGLAETLISQSRPSWHGRGRRIADRPIPTAARWRQQNPYGRRRASAGPAA